MILTPARKNGMVGEAQLGLPRKTWSRGITGSLAVPQTVYVFLLVGVADIDVSLADYIFCEYLQAFVHTIAY